jgi:hypothetical protein
MKSKLSDGEVIMKSQCLNLVVDGLRLSGAQCVLLAGAFFLAYATGTGWRLVAALVVDYAVGWVWGVWLYARRQNASLTESRWSGPDDGVPVSVAKAA